MRWACLVWAAIGVLLVACSVDSSLTCGVNCGDAAQDATVPDAPADSPGVDAPKDAPVPIDATTDAPGDAPSDAPVPTDGACTTSCPTGTTCNGSFCQVPQGTACNAAISTAGSGGALDGTVCAGTGPTVATTCTSPMTASATFVRFTSGGDPWNVTVKAVNGPLQIEVMSACGTGIACYDLASGASTVIVVNQDTVLAIVNGNGSTCTNWQIPYVSK